MGELLSGKIMVARTGAILDRGAAQVLGTVVRDGSIWRAACAGCGHTWGASTRGVAANRVWRHWKNADESMATTHVWAQPKKMEAG